MKHSVRIAIVVLLLGALAAGEVMLLSRPRAAPELNIHTLDGRLLTSAMQREKMLLVTFWATSCGTCAAEMPDLVRLYRDYREHGLEMVAVAMSYDPEPNVRAYMDSKALPFPVASDADGRLAGELEVHATPTSFLIDREGRIVLQTVGLLDFASLRRLLDHPTNRRRTKPVPCSRSPSASRCG
ncbi:MAG: TlpA family protein disulfide reductase [Nitrosomonadales bacterium]|nr:TlpA family protein disulfide reductase [Nitrosomonadales bacterium]